MPETYKVIDGPYLWFKKCSYQEYSCISLQISTWCKNGYMLLSSHVSIWTFLLLTIILMKIGVYTCLWLNWTDILPVGEILITHPLESQLKYYWALPIYRVASKMVMPARKIVTFFGNNFYFNAILIANLVSPIYTSNWCKPYCKTFSDFYSDRRYSLNSYIARYRMQIKPLVYLASLSWQY